MVKENKKMKCYYCEECEMVYLDIENSGNSAILCPEFSNGQFQRTCDLINRIVHKKKACECEEWCKEHKSCNLEIIKYAFKEK